MGRPSRADYEHTHMSSRDPRQSSRTSQFESDQVDLHRYLSALSRSRVLIVVIVVGFTGVVLALSMLLPKSYRASATVILESTGTVLAPADPQTQQRELATVESLLFSQAVLDQATGELGLPRDQLELKLESAVDSEANIIEIAANDGSPEEAARIANTAASALIDARGEAEKEQFSNAREQIAQEIRRLRASGDPDAAVQIPALQKELGDLSLQEQLAGSDLQLASPAQVPAAPNSPRPLRNGVLAFFASLFLAVLIALVRDQLRPKVNSPRELSRLTNLPVLAGIPYVRSFPGRAANRFGRRAQVLTAAEHEAYQSLQNALMQTLPERGQHVILVSSAVHGEGKTTVVGRLGRALAHSGNKTLLVGADLRFPRLHSLFGLPATPGLANILELAGKAGQLSDLVLPATVRAANAHEASNGAGPSNLHVLTSGTSTLDPSQLLTVEALTKFIEHVRRFDYRYVLIDAPPLLGIADSQSMIKVCDNVLVVARLDRVTTENVIDTDELLSRFDAHALGLVVIGARAELSSYYLGQRAEYVGVGTRS